MQLSSMDVALSNLVEWKHPDFVALCEFEIDLKHSFALESVYARLQELQVYAHRAQIGINVVTRDAFKRLIVVFILLPARSRCRRRRLGQRCRPLLPHKASRPFRRY
jgi:hypothetical protein